MDATLNNLHVLVTRPLKQALQTREKFQAAGARVTLFPLLEIAPASLPETARQQLADTHSYNCVIFISRNAVEYAFSLGGEAFNKSLQHRQIGAIGKQTALALAEQYITVDFLPKSGFTSEDYLALPALQTVNNQRFLIIRGEGGRELLAETLRQRGARVNYANVYRRVCPADSTAEKIIQHYNKQQIDIISLTSGEGLHNLLMLVGNVESFKQIKWLKKTTLLVGSQRIAEDARNAGFKADIIIADDPGDQSMQEALTRWRQDSMR